MIWYDMIYGMAMITIPALASNISHLVWVITDQCMYGPPPAPATPQPLRVQKLHFPPSGKASAEASWCPAMHWFKFTSMCGIHKFEFSIHAKYWPAHVHVPTCPYAWPIPWECGSSTFFPWERPAPGPAGTPFIYWFKLIGVCVAYEHTLYRLRIL